MFRLNTRKLSIAPGQRILKAGDFALFLEANQIIEAAEEQAKMIATNAELAYAERKEQGYEDGILEGRMEYAEKMLDTAIAAVDYLEKLEQDLVKTVTMAVRKVIGELDNKEQIVRIVRSALLNIHSQQRVLVKISPLDEAYVREDLELMLKSAPGSLSYIDIVPDPRMNQGDCILESELGLLDAGLETQLKAIENSLLRKTKSR